MPVNLGVIEGVGEVEVLGVCLPLTVGALFGTEVLAVVEVDEEAEDAFDLFSDVFNKAAQLVAVDFGFGLDVSTGLLVPLVIGGFFTDSSSFIGSIFFSSLGFFLGGIPVTKGVYHVLKFSFHPKENKNNKNLFGRCQRNTGNTKYRIDFSSSDFTKAKRGHKYSVRIL